MNKEYMENYVGVTKETISRKLSKPQDLDIIKLVGNKVIIIKNEDALKEFIEQIIAVVDMILQKKP